MFVCIRHLNYVSLRKSLHVVNRIYQLNIVQPVYVYEQATKDVIKIRLLTFKSSILQKEGMKQTYYNAPYILELIEKDSI